MNDRNFIESLLDDSHKSRIHDLKRSIMLSAKALQLSKAINEKALIGKSMNQLSLFYMISGAYKKSISMAKGAILVFNELNDEKGIADANFNIASVYYKTDNYHLGLINLIDCLTTYQKVKDYFNQARVLKSLGTIYEYFGDQGNAIISYQKAIVAAKKIRDKNLVSNVYNPLSGIYLKQHKLKKAFGLIDRSIFLKNETGDIRGLAFAIYGRAKIYTYKKEYELAEQDFKQAIAIHLSVGEKLGLGMAYQKLGFLYKQWRKLDKGKAILQEAIKVSTAYNTVIIKFKSNYLLYQISKLENDGLKALAYLELYLDEKEKVINTQTLQIIESYELITQMHALEKEEQLRKEKAEIIEKKERAEQSALIKQEFLSTMSHEIRTPLNAITTISTLISDKYSGDDKPLIDALKSASKSLLLLVNDVLDFTKLDSGSIELNERTCDLKGLIRQISNTYKHLAIEKGIEMLIEFDDDLHPAYTLDEARISQILSHLISNAIKFTETGTVSLSVSKIFEEKDFDTVLFEVSDTGVGIPEGHFDQIFESFTQPNSITTKKHGGKGLGLAIVKKLLELHGSDIKFKSMQHNGSLFHFELRLKRDTLPSYKNTEVGDLLRNKRVLLSEDNKINAMVVTKLLSNWGIIIEHVVNGLKAVEKSKELSFDFILMDIHMPEMNGFEAAAKIRSTNNPNKYTPIFALTADLTAESNSTYAIYFEGFLHKPIEIEKLYHTLAKVIG